jgi:hypothetical protein
MTRWLPVAVLAVVVLAGCMGAPTAAPSTAGGDAPDDPTDPTSTPSTGTPGSATPTEGPGTPTEAAAETATPTETAADATAIRVRGGRLPVDANATFGRLVGLLDANASPPGYVVALTESDLPNASPGGATPGQSFRSVMGVVPEPNATGSLPYRYPAMTSSVGVASVYPGDKPAGLVETILAHELVHYVQFRAGYATELRGSIPVGTTDGRFAFRSVLEGMAVYVTDAYVERHVPNVASNSALYDRIENVTPPGTPGRYGNAWYASGADYAAARLDSPAEVERLVEAPPTTSEQVIHGYAPGVEPPRPLSVSVAESEWSAIGSDRKGEALLRVVLQNGLPEAAADRAAAGWGNDSLTTLRSGSSVGYAWAIRWDDRANATEFESAFREYLDARGNRSGGVRRVDGNAFDLRRASPDTTVVLVGNRSFVTGTEVTADGAAVSVRPQGANASSSADRNGTERSGAVGVAVEPSKEVTRSGGGVSRPQSAGRRLR